MADKREDAALSTPKETGFTLFPRIRTESDVFGRASEGIARFMGTPAFLVGLTLVCILWVVWNVWAPEELRFDSASHGFTALTLILSLQASYAAPLILLAQNRQEARDRLALGEDRRVAAQSRADMDFLAREIAALRASVGEAATRDFVRGEIRDQLRDLLEELQKRETEAAQPPAAQ
jgi:uncharacterized membrane protein